MHPSAVLFPLLAAAVKAATVQLPSLTGSFPVGTIALELVDYSRDDPLAPTAQPRRLMASLFYPTSEQALRAGNYSYAPYFSTQAAAIFDSYLGMPAGTTGSIVTQAHANAPLSAADLPVLIHSHGFSSSRLIHAAQLAELASQGWIVVAVDHTYEALAVEFPDGTLVPATHNDSAQYPGGSDGLVELRAADVAFVRNALKNSTILEQIPGVPASCGAKGGGLRADEVGVFGTSLGGATSAQVVQSYDGFVAGANFDGDMFASAAQTGFDKPFLQLASDERFQRNDTTWAVFWEHLTGFRREFRINGTVHMTYTDFPVLLDLFGPAIPAQVRAQFGAIAGVRLLQIETAIIDAFFAIFLKSQPAEALDNLAGGTFDEVTVPA